LNGQKLIHNIPTGETLPLRGKNALEYRRTTRREYRGPYYWRRRNVSSNDVRFSTNENTRENLYIPVSLLGSVSCGHTRL